jgi:histone H3/H4
MTAETTQEAGRITVSRDDLTEALDGFYLTVRNDNDTDRAWGQIADAAEVAGALHATLSRIAAERAPDADRWEPARYSLDGYAREHLVESWREVEGRGIVVIGADMAETELRTARDAEMYLAGLASAECAIHAGKVTL